MKPPNSLCPQTVLVRLMLCLLLTFLVACSDKNEGSGVERDANDDVLLDGDIQIDGDADADSGDLEDGEELDTGDSSDDGSDSGDSTDAEVIEPTECESDDDCDDGSSCTVDVCNSDSGTCEWTPDDSVCEDGLFCNGAEQCVADSVFADAAGCVAGKAPSVADGISCTTGSCDEETDEIVQTTDDTVCDDANDCTADSCDLSTGCANVPANAGGVCENGTGICDDSGGCLDCVASDDVSPNLGCSPGSPVCAEGRCTQCATSEDCSAGLSCDDGVCVGCTVDAQCNDGVGCTEDVCNLTTATCSNTPKDSLCDNSLFCDGMETCVPDSSLVDAGGCLPGTAPVVDDGVDCTDDRCDEDADVVVHEQIHSACDDGQVCTTDRCSLTGCRNNAMSVGTACTDGSDEGVCDDEGSCSVCADDRVGAVDTGCTDEAPDCIEGICGLCSEAGPDCPLDCEGVPGGPAIEDACGVCDDDPSNNCIESCNGIACVECSGDDDPACDDGNECTVDSCVDGYCARDSESLNDVQCMTDNACIADAVCSAGECEVVEELACDGACETGTCDPISGCGLVPSGTTCDDGYSVTADGQCNASGKCTTECIPLEPCLSVALEQGDDGESIVCVDRGARDEGAACSDDGDPCTLDICDALGACTHPANPDCGSCDDIVCDGPCHTGTCVEGVGCEWVGEGTACDDGDGTTTGDVCNAVGVCSGSCPELECGRYGGFGLGGRCSGLVTSDQWCEDDDDPCTVAVCNSDGSCSQVPVSEGSPCAHPCGAGACSESGVCELSRDGCVANSTRCFRGVCNTTEGRCERIPYHDEDCLNEALYCDEDLAICTGGYCTDGVCGGNPELDEDNYHCPLDCAADCTPNDSDCEDDYTDRKVELGAWMAHMSLAYGIRSVNTHQTKSITQMLDDGVRWLHLRMDYCNAGADEGPLCFCAGDDTCPVENVRAETILDEIAAWMDANTNQIVTLYIDDWVAPDAMRGAMEDAGLDQLVYHARSNSGNFESFPLTTGTMVQKNERLVIFGGPYLRRTNVYLGTDHDTDEPDGPPSFSGIFKGGPAVYNCADFFGVTPAEKPGFSGLYAIKHTPSGLPSWTSAACYNPYIEFAYNQCEEYYPVNAVFVDFYNSSAAPLEFAGYDSPYEDRCSDQVTGCLTDDDCESGICGGLFICLNCESSDDCQDEEFCDTIWGSCVPKVEDGTICLNDGECASGNCEAFICQSCSQDSDCDAEEWCDVFGGCQPKKFNGAGCITDKECVSDACNFGFCAECNDQDDCPGTDQFCTVNPIPGQSECIPTKPNGTVCANHFECEGGACFLGFCSDCNEHSDCTNDEYCTLSIGAASTCEPKKPLDDSCASNVECTSDTCSLFTCAQICGNNADCDDDRFCDGAGFCQLKKDLGSQCLVFSECKSDACFLGQCVECDSQDDCGGGTFCSLDPVPGESACIPRKDNGGLCAQGFECASGNCFPPLCSECDEHSDCQAGEFCTLNPLPMEESVCETKKPNNSLCATGVECQSGDCVAALCVDGCDSNADCDPGLFCDVLGACRQRGEVGAPCSENDACTNQNCYLGFCVRCNEQGDCSGNQFCSLDPEPGQSACIDKKANGSLCAQNLECETDNCWATVCSECNEHTDCQSGDYCTLDVLPPIDSTCEAKKPNGEFCGTGVECQSGDCITATCVDACDTGADCASNEWCDVAGICQPKWEIGHACVTGVECQSGDCFSGFCVACDEQSDCGGGTFCSLDPAPGASACIPKKGNGSLCAQNLECATDNCWLSVCSECNEQSDCSSNEFCTLDAVPPINSTCESKKSNGSSCGSAVECTSDQCTLFVCGECKDDGQCSSSQHCDAFNNCVNDVGNNAPCLRDSQCSTGICSAGFCAECTSDSHCSASEHCDVGGDCVPDVGNNAPCVRDSVCSTGICSAGFCAECLGDGGCPSSQHCDAGGDCVNDVGNNAPCLRNSVCSTGICSAGFCAECLGDGNCPSSQHCDAFGDCINDVGNNSPCIRNAVCNTGICSAGFCAQCTNDGHCSSSQFCNGSGDCEGKKGRGHVCVEDRVCSSGTCSFGFCT